MLNNKSSVGVGVGVIILNYKNEILLQRRIGSHAQKYSIPGGRIELGETFEAAALREVKEEINITLTNPYVIAITNNLETYSEEGIHDISVILIAHKYQGSPSIMEPKKCSELLWCDPRQLPEPHYDASRLAIACYLEDVMYKVPR